MNYPQSFIDRCKEVFPVWYSLHELLDNKSVFVGRYLCGASQEQISYIDVLNAQTLEEIQAQAMQVQLKKNLYSEWNILYSKHIKKAG